MPKKKNTLSNDEALKNRELNLEELEDVSGGSLKNVSFTKTEDISKDTKSKLSTKFHIG